MIVSELTCHFPLSHLSYEVIILVRELSMHEPTNYSNFFDFFTTSSQISRKNAIVKKQFSFPTAYALFIFI